ncbi:MAG: NAD(+)/NADH kinase [Ruminococcaceae bacterium]|nr:NAD(+)/NADH kinase [Oscillospiraceae bacterium]
MTILKLYLIPNDGKAQAFTSICELRQHLAPDEAQFLLHRSHCEGLGQAGDLLLDSEEELIRQCDAVVVLGGDGTIIHAAKQAAKIAGKPVLGINVGRLGFTAGLERTELPLIRKLITEEYTTEKRMMLEVCVTDNEGRELYRSLALNDAVIARGALPHIIDLRTYRNDRLAMDFRADGVIVSTPTGSTAYSLSAGGPAIDPTVKCIMLTPVCAHSLYTRPIIFSENTEITIEVVRTEGDIAAYLTVDGEQSITLKKGSRVSIREAEMTADFIVIKKQCFTEILQQKFYNYMQQEDNNE